MGTICTLRLLILFSSIFLKCISTQIQEKLVMNDTFLVMVIISLFCILTGIFENNFQKQKRNEFQRTKLKLFARKFQRSKAFTV